MPLIKFEQDLSPDECELFSEFLMKLRMHKMMKSIDFTSCDKKAIETFKDLFLYGESEPLTTHYFE